MTDHGSNYGLPPESTYPEDMHETASIYGWQLGIALALVTAAAILVGVFA